MTSARRKGSSLYYDPFATAYCVVPRILPTLVRLPRRVGRFRYPASPSNNLVLSSRVRPGDRRNSSRSGRSRSTAALFSRETFFFAIYRFSFETNFEQSLSSVRTTRKAVHCLFDFNLHPFLRDFGSCHGAKFELIEFQVVRVNDKRYNFHSSKHDSLSLKIYSNRLE